ncbi:EpsG family protein [Pandoraea apista]|uniref:EpsG family protein n=1 Tax=Pandoraea apista TaxID=93218 RepID=UPI0006582E81|nr:EpsG family protein [Pandoraea apista]ALS66408.1 hypothetical protein AT395_16755 [Pandoraea apista]CFB61645.1 hypothetical protein LMG16407_01710 [Pandoraea apista]
MDSLIIPALYVYGAFLFVLVSSKRAANWKIVIVLALALRLFALCFRHDVGHDIENYLAVLQKCDLTSINRSEVFWLVACIPSSITSDIVPFPFLWIGIIDSLLFLVMARLAGWRIAALHDLIYLPVLEMGAIRQALAMKIAVISVILMLRPYRSFAIKNLILTAPLIHLSAIVPTAVIKWMNSRLVPKICLLILLAGATYFIVTPELTEKINYYVGLEGFRSETQIYASWFKRAIITFVSPLMISTLPIYWLLYLIGLAIATFEFYIPEIALRLGAYFEQFEIFLIGSQMSPRMRRMGTAWYLMVALLYTARYFVNLNSIPKL